MPRSLADVVNLHVDTSAVQNTAITTAVVEKENAVRESKKVAKKASKVPAFVAKMRSKGMEAFSKAEVRVCRHCGLHGSRLTLCCVVTVGDDRPAPR